MIVAVSLFCHARPVTFMSWDLIYFFYQVVVHTFVDAIMSRISHCCCCLVHVLFFVLSFSSCACTSLGS